MASPHQSVALRSPPVPASTSEGTLFVYKNIPIRTVDDIGRCVQEHALSEEQHDELSHAVAAAYISGLQRVQQSADPLIAQYSARCEARHLKMEDVMSAGEIAVIEESVRREKVRASRIRTLRTAMEKHGWQSLEAHPYVMHCMLTPHAVQTLTGFIESSPHPPAFCLLNLSRYILFRVQHSLPYSSRDLLPTPKDLNIVRRLLLTDQGCLLDEKDTQGPKTSVGLPMRTFTISSLPICREEIEGAQRMLGRLIRLDDAGSLKSFASDASDLPDLPPSREELQMMVQRHGDGELAEEARAQDEADDRDMTDTVDAPDEPDDRDMTEPADAPSQPGGALLDAVRRFQACTPSDDRIATLLRQQLDQGPMSKKRKTHSAAAEQIDGWKRKCTCHRFGTSAIPDAVRAAIEMLSDLATDHPTRAELETRRQAAIAVARAIGARRVCHSHCFIFASRTGIYKASMSHVLLERIIARYGEQGDGYLASEEAANLIKKPYREPHALDDAGLAQMVPLPPADGPLVHLPAADAQRLLDEMFPGMRQQWHDDGDVMSDVFGWIFADEEARELIDYEVDMYDYHLRLPPGQPRMGWLRNAHFAQIQQLIRMDLLFYAEHVLLHDDHPVRWISYPYEMKLALPYMSTAFAHLDLNVHRVIEDLDGGPRYAVRRYIQSAVSLTAEDPDNCTKLIPGMHQDHIFREWAEDQPANVQAVNASVTFTEEHAARFGTRFRYNVAQAGEARISDPRLLHGTDGPASRRRAVVFAWLVEHDGKTLAHPGTGTVAELSEAHRDLLLGRHLNSPSGYPNKAGTPITPFPASTQLLSSSALSNAIVGRTSYTDPSVQRELRMLFGKDVDARRALIDTTRRELLHRAKENWRHQQEIERAYFGEHSFSVNQGIFRQTNHLQRHTQPTFMEEVQLAKQREREARMQKGTPVEDVGELPDAEDSEEEELGGGDEIDAEITARDGNILRDDRKVHPSEAYRWLGSSQHPPTSLTSAHVSSHMIR